MINQRFSHPKKFILTICLISVFMAGCDKIREKLSGAIHPKSNQERLNLVNAEISQKRFQEALKESELLANDKSEPLRGQFSYASAKSSAQIGDYEKTYFYLAQAMELNVVSSVEILNEPLFYNLKNDTKFVQIFNRFEENKPIISNDTSINAGNNVSIKIDSSGTHIRAGDISINQPN